MRHILFRCQISFGSVSVDEHVRPQNRPMCASVREAVHLRHQIVQADVVIFSQRLARLGRRAPDRHVI